MPAIDTVREITDARVFISTEGNSHVIVISPEHAICLTCQGPRATTCHLISHARYAAAPVVPEHEICPRCAGNGEYETGTHQDRETGIRDTTTVFCQPCHGTGRVTPAEDRRLRSVA